MTREERCFFSTHFPLGSPIVLTLPSFFCSPHFCPVFSCSRFVLDTIRSVFFVLRCVAPNHFRPFFLCSPCVVFVLGCLARHACRPVFCAPSSCSPRVRVPCCVLRCRRARLAAPRLSKGTRPSRGTAAAAAAASAAARWGLLWRGGRVAPSAEGKIIAGWVVVVVGVVGGVGVVGAGCGFCRWG